MVVSGLVGVTALGFGILVGRLLDRKGRVERGLGEEHILPKLEELRSRLEDIEALQGRVVELEERVDFTERLLTEAEDGKALRAER